MKSKALCLISLLTISLFSVYGQDTLTLENQELKLINIISLNKTSLKYVDYYTPTYPASIVTNDEVNKLITGFDPFYKNVNIKIETTDQKVVKGRLIGLNNDGFRFWRDNPKNNTRVFYDYDASSIQEIKVPVPYLVAGCMTTGALIGGTIGINKEAAENASNVRKAEFDNFVNFLTYGGNYQKIEPEVVDRNQFVDTVVGAVIGAAIGALIGSLFKKKININSKYSELSKALSRYKKKYPDWQKKVNITKR